VDIAAGEPVALYGGAVGAPQQKHTASLLLHIGKKERWILQRSASVIGMHGEGEGGIAI
jgi:hypothetical protein